MSAGLDRLSLRLLVAEAGAVIATHFAPGSEPRGLKLSLVRAMRKVEQRGMQAVVEHFGICDECSPVAPNPTPANGEAE